MGLLVSLLSVRHSHKIYVSVRLAHVLLPMATSKHTSLPNIVQSIPIAEVVVPDDPDRFRPGTLSIDDLASSIHQFGLLQPIIVTNSNDSSSYHLLAGHRRLLACIALGHTSISARVLDLPPDSGSSIRLTENIQREDLSPLEEAVAVSRLRDSLSFTQEEVAHHLVKGLNWVVKREALLRLPDDVMDSLQAGQINPSVALELGRIDDDHVRKYYLQSAVDYGATQRVASTWVLNYLRDGSSPDPKEMSDISESVRKASSGHKLPCHVCERSFLLSHLSNFFACNSCIEAIAGATRHVPEN
ncbi:Nucleoid occlusion protein [subsurface metagenome]